MEGILSDEGAFIWLYAPCICVHFAKWSIPYKSEYCINLRRELSVYVRRVEKIEDILIVFILNINNIAAYRVEFK